MSHFGLKGALPVVEAATPAKKVYYGLYSWQHRSYYADDGGGSDSWETLLAVHESPDVLRQELNKIWESSDLFEQRGSLQMVFKEDAMETNSWYSNGGGCGAKGGYKIKAVPSLSDYLAIQQVTIDKAQAHRDKMAEEKRVEREKQEKRAAEQRKWDAYYAQRKIINAEARKKYAANKDEINVKRRAYRAGVAAKKKAEKAEKQAKWDAYYTEYKAATEGITDDKVERAIWEQIYYKHYPKGDSLF